MLTDGQEDWEQLTIVAPRGVAAEVLKLLEQRFSFRHIPNGIDWCVWERPEDFAYADLAPCEPITHNRYVVDWRKGEGRGDVPVIIEPTRRRGELDNEPPAS